MLIAFEKTCESSSTSVFKNKNQLKTHLLITLLIMTFSSHAQITFEGKGKPVYELNTSNGQNYLTIDPISGAFAYTEEQGGQGDENTVDKVSIPDIGTVYRFTDWLGSQGMVSPVGFLSSKLYFNQVSFSQGVYEGRLMAYDLKSGTQQNVNIPFFKNKSPIQSGCMSKDGRYMIVSLESGHTYGVEDLYVIKRKADGSWSKPGNLGAGLNTAYQEVTPFLAEDNRTLFFATNGRGGAGNFDLFYTVRLDDSWRSWSEPVNLGSSVNTSGAETSFAYLDGSRVAYYISAQDSDAYGDIMQVQFKEDIAQDTTELVEQDTVIMVSAATTDAQMTSSFVLKVVDDATGVSLQSSMIRDGEVTQSERGIFKLDSLTDETIEIKASGYLPKILTLSESLQEGENLVKLSSIKKGSVITLKDVLFQRGTADMLEEAQKELDLVVEVMNDNPAMKILLKGHTDNMGDPIKNIQLSEARVRAVKIYIVSSGISAYRVSGKGYGGNQPIASNETEETRKRNRRVEFEVLED